MGRGLNYPLSKYVNSDVREAGTIFVNVEPGHEDFIHVIPLLSFGDLRPIDISLIYIYSERSSNIGFGNGVRLSITYNLTVDASGDFLTLKYPDGFSEIFNKRTRDIEDEDGEITTKTDYLGAKSFNSIEEIGNNYILKLKNGFSYLLNPTRIFPNEIRYNGILTHTIRYVGDSFEIINYHTGSSTLTFTRDINTDNYIQLDYYYTAPGGSSSVSPYRYVINYVQNVYLSNITIVNPKCPSTAYELKQIEIINNSSSYKVTSVNDDIVTDVIITADKVSRVERKTLEIINPQTPSYNLDKTTFTYVDNGTGNGKEVKVEASNGTNVTYHFYSGNLLQYVINSDGNYARYDYKGSTHQLERTISGLSTYINSTNDNYIKNGSFKDGNTNYWTTSGTINVSTLETMPFLPGINYVCDVNRNSEISQSFSINGDVNTTISVSFWVRNNTDYTLLYYKLQLIKDGAVVKETTKTYGTRNNFYELHVLEITAKQMFDEVRIIFTGGDHPISKSYITDIIVKSYPIVTSYEYDENGNVSKETRGIISSNSEYDAYSNLINNYSLGNSGTNCYKTTEGLPLQTSSSTQGVRLNNIFNNSGQINSKTMTDGHGLQLVTSGFTYYSSDNSKPKKVINACGKEIIYNYTANTQKVMKVTYQSINWNYEYNNHYRLVSRTIKDNNNNDNVLYTYSIEYMNNKFANRITKITTPAYSYYFDYTNRFDLSKISFENANSTLKHELTKYLYKNEKVSSSYDNYNLMTKNYPNGKYKFVYNVKDLVSQVQYEDDNEVTTNLFDYEYNELEQVTLIRNIQATEYSENYYYNNNNMIARVVGKDNDEIAFKYDSLNELSGYVLYYNDVMKNVELNDSYRLYDFNTEEIYAKIQNSTTRYANFANLFTHTKLSGNNYGVLSDKIIPNLIRFETVNDEIIKKEISANIKDYNVHYDGRFNAFKFNSGANKYLEYIHNYTSNPIFNNDAFTISFWFKVDDIYYDYGLISIFDGPSKNTIVQINTDDQQNVYVDIKFAGQSIKRAYVTSKSRYRSGWNFVSFSWKRYNSSPCPSEYILGLNGEYTYKLVTNSTALIFPNNSSLIIGAGLNYALTTLVEADALITGIVIDNNPNTDVAGILNYYKMSRKLYLHSGYLNNNLLTTTNSGVNDYAYLDTIPSNYKVFPLHQSVFGLDGNNDVSYTPSNLLESELDPGFAFNNRLKRYMYVAEGDALVYHTGLSDSGFIAMYFTREEDHERQCLFEATSDNELSFSIERRESTYTRRFFLVVNGTSYAIGGLDNINERTYVGVTWSKTVSGDSYNPNVYRFRVLFNNTETIHDISLSESFSNINLSVGRKTNTTPIIGNKANTSYPLYGQIEFLVYNNLFMSKASINALKNKLNGITTSTQGDGFGLVRYQSITRGDISIMSKEYSYYLPNETQKISELPTKEVTTWIQGVKTRDYEYDAFGNLEKIYENNVHTRTFEYDKRGFLIKETWAQGGSYYNYNSAGNITAITGFNAIDYYYEEGASAKLQRLIQSGEEYIDYVNNSLLPSSIYNMVNGVKQNIANLSWQGRRLISYVDSEDSYNYSYAYNYAGLRVKKVVNGVTTHFTYFNDLLMLERRGNIIIRYRYDKSGIYGFTIEEGTTLKEYFYDRDVFGNINGIYDETGNKVVTYNYTAYGLLHSMNDSSPNNIGTINKIRYKGYYYDDETSFYYCKSRYYVPRFTRWLSGDDVAYLNPATVTGLNLFVYCNNNPLVNNHDYYIPAEKKYSTFNNIIANASFRKGFFFGEAAITMSKISGNIGSQLDIKKGKLYIGAFVDYSLLNLNSQLGVGNETIHFLIEGSGDLGAFSLLSGFVFDIEKESFFVGIGAEASLLSMQGD
ncbi:MAG: tRNA nuclease WapA precursor [Tenericutes bacterium ADurb.Bin087]|nr:MAG: tRNA nuclease WapA precursor [Tenericutes bacterium ADurb.Bin087]